MKFLIVLSLAITAVVALPILDVNLAPKIPEVLDDIDSKPEIKAVVSIPPLGEETKAGVAVGVNADIEEDKKGVVEVEEDVKEPKEVETEPIDEELFMLLAVFADPKPDAMPETMPGAMPEPVPEATLEATR